MRANEFTLRETAGAIGVPVPNIKVLIPKLVAKSLPQLINIKTIPGVFNIYALLSAGLNLYNGDYTSAALNTAMVFTPPMASLVLVAVEIINSNYSEMFVYKNGEKASAVRDMATDPVKFKDNISYMTSEFVEYLQELIGVGKQKISGKQGQQNMRAAMTGMDTPNNPDPRKHPERYPSQ